MLVSGCMDSQPKGKWEGGRRGGRQKGGGRRVGRGGGFG